MISASTALRSEFRMPEFTPEQKAERARRAAEIEAVERERVHRSRIESAQIPRRFRDAYGVSDELRAWILSPSDGVVLTGSFGTGKTWTACALLAEYMDTWHCSGYFITAVDYINACRAGEAGTLERCRNARALVLDDLGKENPSAYTTSELFDLLARRGDSERKTIITTNYTGRQLMERMTFSGDPTTAQALFSRLFAFKAVRMDGEDRRKEAHDGV